MELKKYGKSIFFLRFLLNKNPHNEFYLALAEKIMRLSTGKLFINSIVKKGEDWELTNGPSNGSRNFVEMFYLTALEYM